jgi:hypothetical protein
MRLLTKNYIKLRLSALILHTVDLNYMKITKFREVNIMEVVSR